MKIYLLILMLLFSKSSLAQESFNKVIEKAQLSTVHLKVIKNIVLEKNSNTITSSVGSGVIMDSMGTIITNAHVVNKVKNITVTTFDGKNYDAKIIGLDVYSDIAVIRINKTTIPIQTTSYKTLNKGDWVIAIGSPLGLDFSATKGIVSFKDRDTNKNIKYIQSDVPINVGNSGGPLLNSKGQLVGINSSLISESGGYQGISLSIPIDIALSVYNEILLKGFVSRGIINVELMDVITIANNIENKLVIVTKDSADKNSFKKDDVIVSIDNTLVNSILDIERYMANIKPNNKVIIKVFRFDRNIQLIIDVVNRKED